jgi:CheY-like chemotaxis protein
MATRTALTLADQLADPARAATPAEEVSSQAAAVRALVDEVERSHPEDRLVAPLRQQLGDELERLADLIAPGSSRETPVTDDPVDVLVVDDEEASLRASVAAVMALGYPCRVARDGSQALHAYAERPAAIVLSDWCMPGMSGIELCRALKAMTPPPYVILATAFHENARVLDAVSGGVDDFLRKPLVLDELEARMLAASRLIRALRMVARVQAKLRAG